MGEGIEKEGCGQLLRKGLECRAPGIGLLFRTLQATLWHFKQVKHAVFLSRIVWAWGLGRDVQTTGRAPEQAVGEVCQMMALGKEGEP